MCLIVTDLKGTRSIVHIYMYIYIYTYIHIHIYISSYFFLFWNSRKYALYTMLMVFQHLRKRLTSTNCSLKILLTYENTIDLDCINIIKLAQIVPF